MKVVPSKNDAKKRKREETQDAIDESPKKAKVHAQRKFAQGASYSSPSITLIKDKVRPPANVSSPGLVLSAKIPNTEDFLTFLCFRRTSILPPKLDFFKDAFKQQPVPFNCVQKPPTSSSIHKNHIHENSVKSSAKKNEKSESSKKMQTPVQALRRKYQEQRLAKQNPTNVTKLAQKVKGKNMIRTRSSTLQDEKVKPTKELTFLNDGKETLSGLRSGLQRSPPVQSKLIKKNKKVMEVKNLRSRLKGNTIENIKFNSLPEKRAKNSPRENAAKKSEAVKNVKSTENLGKAKEVRVNTKKIEGLSDFSSDDNEPLLAVKKGKPILKGKKLANGVKEVVMPNNVKTRSQISDIFSPIPHVPIRPTRKTKEAAALYMEMITKKLVSPEKSGDDDRSSVDSFPELPNAKRNEQRETEIKAKAMALKKGNARENSSIIFNGRDRGLRSSGLGIRKRERSKRSDSSSGKTEIPKKYLKESKSKKMIKEEPVKRILREPSKKHQQYAKSPVAKKSIKEEAPKKITEDSPRKICKEENRLRTFREDQTKKSFKEVKKISKDEVTKKIIQEDVSKKTGKEDTQKKNLKDDIAKKGIQEELVKKNFGKNIPEEDSTRKKVKEEVRKTIKEETAKPLVDDSMKRPVKEEQGKKVVKDEAAKKLEEGMKKLSKDEQLKKEVLKKGANEDLLKKTVADGIGKRGLKDKVESIKDDMEKEVSQNSVKKNDIPKKIAKEDVEKKETQEVPGIKVDEQLSKEEDNSKNCDDATKQPTSSTKKSVKDEIMKKQDALKTEEFAKTPEVPIIEESLMNTQEEPAKKLGKEEVKKKNAQNEPKKDESAKKAQKEDSKKTTEIEVRCASEVTNDEMRAKEDSTKTAKIQSDKEEGGVKKGEKKDHILQGKDAEKDHAAKRPGRNSSKEETHMTEETEARPSTRGRKHEEPEVKQKKVAERTSATKRPNSLPKKGSSNTSSASSSNWLPPPGSDSNLVEAPTFYPTEKEFQDPLEFFERIRPAAESFGLCRIVPPSTFKPDCKVSDDMRFTAYNQYVHRMFHRWGPNIKEMMAIKKYLATQSISLKQPPWIGGIEVDLPRLYQSVQNCGGLMKVMEKKKWHQVADMMRIPKAAQDRVTKLDDIYCKYLLPYDTLSHDERQKLFDEVESDWIKRQETPNDSTGEESEEESYIDECEECIVKGRNMALNQFYRIARNTMSMWFKTQEPAPSEVENEFWRHVSERTHHVCVHSGSIDSSGWGYGFPVAKNNSFSRHPWNLKVLTNNNGSVLRSLGPVMGVTVPTLHVGMVFTAFCWYRDPHGLPWVEYLHTGAPKIWYGISDDNSSVFKDALTKLLPRYIKNKKIWLTSDTAMVPPALLVEQGVSLCHTIQKPGQFILVFPRAFTSSICTGYLVSESVYFAQPSWLTTAEQVFRDIQDCSEPTMFSLEKLLFSIASDARSSVDVLKQVLPMVWHIKQKEIDGRKTLMNLGLKVSERLPVSEQGGSKRKKGRWAQDGEGDYECEVCRTNLCVSLVINSQEEGVLCLPHAIEHLTQKRHHLKNCKLMYSYTQEELCELVEKLEQRIESKSQRKVQNKTTAITTNSAK